jgi:hypothetical protein
MTGKVTKQICRDLGFKDDLKIWLLVLDERKISGGKRNILIE